MIRATPAASWSVSRVPAELPFQAPRENVEGLVASVDAARKLAEITIGSEAGVAQGQIFHVFRFGPTPRESKYLGTLRVLEVRDKEAIGELLEKRFAGLVRPGDRVAVRIKEAEPKEK